MWAPRVAAGGGRCGAGVPLRSGPCPEDTAAGYRGPVTALPSPTPEQRAAVDRLARFAVRFGLTVPAILAIESMTPLAYSGSQLMHLLTPSIAVFLSPVDWEALSTLLEHRRGLEVVLRRIEQLDAAYRDQGELPEELPWEEGSGK